MHSHVLISTMWQLINKQIGKTQVDDKKFELRVGKNLITNPSKITEILNKHFTDIMTEGIKNLTQGIITRDP